MTVCGVNAVDNCANNWFVFRLKKDELRCNWMQKAAEAMELEIDEDLYPLFHNF